MSPSSSSSSSSSLPVSSSSALKDKTSSSTSRRSQAPALDIDLHVKYIQELDLQTQDLAYHLTEHLRLNGIYWGLTALSVMGRQDALDTERMKEWVRGCWDEEMGAFGAHPRHDGHLLSTLSAIQIFAMLDSMDLIDKDRVVAFILSLIDPLTGAVSGDSWGEQDTRFSYIAISSLSLLGRLSILDDPNHPALPSALKGKDVRGLLVGHLERCRNFDGGFGSQEGSETHGGQIFVCVAALAILERLDLVDADKLAWWLCERQLPNGGLNGRPEKLEDVCYSWWDLTGLAILKKLHWIDRRKLADFILHSQDLEGGGIADRPGDWVDVFHTNFGVAGLSMLGYPGLASIDPIYCMPADLIQKMGLKKDYQLLGPLEPEEE